VSKAFSWASRRSASWLFRRMAFTLWLFSRLNGINPSLGH
jgi:hypothetical protein